MYRRAHSHGVRPGSDRPQAARRAATATHPAKRWEPGQRCLALLDYPAVVSEGAAQRHRLDGPPPAASRHRRELPARGQPADLIPARGRRGAETQHGEDGSRSRDLRRRQFPSQRNAQQQLAPLADPQRMTLRCDVLCPSGPRPRVRPAPAPPAIPPCRKPPRPTRRARAPSRLRPHSRSPAAHMPDGCPPPRRPAAHAPPAAARRSHVHLGTGARNEGLQRSRRLSVNNPYAHRLSPFVACNP